MKKRELEIAYEEYISTIPTKNFIEEVEKGIYQVNLGPKNTRLFIY